MITIKDYEALRAWLHLGSVYQRSFSCGSSKIERKAFDMKLQLRDGIAYYPIVCSSHLFSYDTEKLKNFDEIILPIFESDAPTQNIKTFKQIIKIVGVMERYQERLVSVKLGDLVYYLGSGIILDNNMKPLMIICVREDERPLTHWTAFFSPKILINNNAMSIGLKKYIIPFLVELHKLDSFRRSQYTATIVFSDDINNFIVYPEHIEFTENLDKELAHLSQETVIQILQDTQRYYDNPT